MRVCLVMCYGVYLEMKRKERQTDRYAKYLVKVAKYVAKGGFDKIVLCGGHTNSEYPELAESATALKLMLEESGLDEDRFVLVEDSLNMVQNIYLGWRKFRDLKKLKQTIDCVIVADHKHILKARSIVFHLRKKRKVCRMIGQVGYKSFHRSDIHPRNNWPYQLAQAVGYLVRPKYIEDHLKSKQRRD